MPGSQRPSLTNVYLVTGVAAIGLLPSALLGKQPPPAIALFGRFAPMFAVVAWFYRYVRGEPSMRVHDWGWLFALAWPVTIPWYAVRVEGRRGWVLASLLIGLIFAPEVLAAAVWATQAR